MSSWLTGRNLALAAGCAGAAAVVLFPGSLITLCLGGVLGYKGREWLATQRGAAGTAQAGTSDLFDKKGGRTVEDRGGKIP